jgi:putative ABC transport system ATP-binding protein
MGFIFQRNHLVSSLNVEDNLLMAPYLANLPQDKSRVKAVLERLGLSEKRHARIQDLSQGQAQRVAIARAVMNKPAVLLADEPTSALDDSHCEKVIDLLLEVASENQSTVIVATHDQRLKTRIPNQIKL